MQQWFNWRKIQAKIIHSSRYVYFFLFFQNIKFVDVSVSVGLHHFIYLGSLNHHQNSHFLYTIFFIYQRHSALFCVKCSISFIIFRWKEEYATKNFSRADCIGAKAQAAAGAQCTIKNRNRKRKRPITTQCAKANFKKCAKKNRCFFREINFTKILV